MAQKSFSYHLLMLLMYASFAAHHEMVMANDADILKDYEVPTNLTSVDAKYFTYKSARSLVGDPLPTTYNATSVCMKDFPALKGQGVSLEVVRFPGGVVSPLHSHPRSTELLLLLHGVLKVGFIDTNNKLYNQTLQAGDMFVFPKGLVHYQHNYDPSEMAVAIAAFGSANPGLVSLPANLFNTGIDDAILAQAFKTDMPTIKKLKGAAAKAGHH